MHIAINIFMSLLDDEQELKVLDHYLKKPGSSAEHLQLIPGERGRRCVCPVGEHLMHVGRPPQGAVMHQERDAIITAEREI